MIDIDATADVLYREAGADPCEPPGPYALACALLGADSVCTHAGIRSPALYVGRLRELWIRPGLAPRRLAWCVAHELAERELARSGYDAADLEDACDSLAAALVMPRPAFRAALRVLGRHLPDLADAFCATQSVVALRLGEVTGSPLALVTPRRVHVRGESSWIWPSEREIRTLALSAAPLPSGVERVPVTDAPRRAVLAATA